MKNYLSKKNFSTVFLFCRKNFLRGESFLKNLCVVIFLQNKYFKIALKVLPVVAVIFLLVLEILSRSAAGIFNKVVEEQKIFRGTFTVEKISANPLGEVSFENLVWKNDAGLVMLEIPEGGFKVKILDIITQNFKTSTIQEISLKNATISLLFDDDMKIDFVHRSHELKNFTQKPAAKKPPPPKRSEEEMKELGRRRREMQQTKIEQGWKNFNLEGNKVKLNLKLEDCRVEIFYRERHYLFGNVNFETKIDTGDKMTLEARTGLFGGTMIGRGMKLNGEIDFKPEIPECDLSILFQEVDPSSLGFGLNIHDEMTFLAHFKGSISKPVGIGTVKIPELHIPGLNFKNVTGNIHYEDSMLKFSEVTGEVYGGTLDAYGDYNIDTRYYNIYGDAKKLKTYYALPGSHLHCDVDLKIAINSKGNAKETATSGSFTSSKGRYSVIKIDGISGKFKTEYNSINFYDVELAFWGYKISTDALSIVDKKLNLAPITITDETGRVLMTYQK